MHLKFLIDLPTSSAETSMEEDLNLFLETTTSGDDNSDVAEGDPSATNPLSPEQEEDDEGKADDELKEKENGG